MDFVSVVERISAFSDAPVRINTRSCLRAIDRYNTCELCASACPVQAISIQAEPQLDEQKCGRCGLCMQVCPVGVFQAEDGIADLFRCFQVMGKADIAEISCASHAMPEYGPEEAQIVLQTKHCLVNLGPSVFLGLFKMGLRKIILRLDACNACSYSSACTKLQDAVEKTNQLVRTCAEQPCVELITRQAPGWIKRPVTDIKNPPMSRRSFFDMFSQSSMRVVGQMMIDPKAAGKMEKQPSRERQRLANALSLFPELITPDSLSRLSSIFPITDLVVSGACTGCGLCASMCPSGALQFESQNEQQYSLKFSPARCVSCGICAEYCEPGAIRLQKEAEPGACLDPRLALQERVVISGELQRCDRCHADFARKKQNDTHGSQNLCPLCEFRRSQPFGFALPRKTNLKIGAFG